VSAASATHTAPTEQSDGPRIALRFAVTALLTLGLAGISVFFVVRNIFLHMQEAQAATHTQLVSKIVLARSLRPGDFTKPSPKRRRELDNLFRTDVLTSSTVALAIYAPDGRVTYSTDGRDIGRRTSLSTFVVDSERLPQISMRETQLPVEGAPRKVIAHVVPLRFGNAATAGAVVVLVDYATLAHAAARSYIPVSIALELLVGILILALVPPTRRAAKQARQHVQDARSHALRDTLTGLPNRRLFEDRLTQTVAQAQRDSSSAAVMLIDLDRFKEINDTLGHAAGDVMLRETALRLVEVLRDTDTVARLGGDEFAIVLGDGTLNAVHETALRMRQAMEVPVEHDGMSLSVGASIGVAVYPDHGKSVPTLLRHADLAMYQAKRAGLGHVVFDAGSTTQDEADLMLAAELGGALERGEIVLHYQPTVALESLEVVGVEALLRWDHPKQGHLAADRFMPLAEQAGVRAAIYEYALAEAVRQTGEWGRAGLTLSVAINLDARTLVDRELPNRVERLLDAHGVDGTQLEAEIAEMSLLGDVERVTTGAIELAALGVILVVDDFGADTTSLNSLAYLPIEKLKINRALLIRALDSQRERIVLAGIVELAHKLGLKVVVAGVESEEMLELLRELGVEHAQGYHLGAPMSVSAVERLLGVPA
jgi:diguanylate cyclase (GGDEF)-like protein